jgi:hypothetical protein
MTVLYRPGGFNDVAVWIDGRLIHVTADGARVRCFLEDTEIWNWLAPETLLFCRGAVQGNLMLTVHQGQSGTGWLVGSGLVRDLGMTFGVQPVGIDAHEAYVVDRAGHYAMLGLLRQPYPFPPGVPPDSSQGLSDVQPDGTLWFADIHRTVVINGVTFTKPNVRGPVTVGQVDGGIAAAVGGKVTLVIPATYADWPHVAVSPNGRVAICASTDHKPDGAAYVATTIQELSA